LLVQSRHPGRFRPLLSRPAHLMAQTDCALHPARLCHASLAAIDGEQLESNELLSCRNHHDAPICRFHNLPSKHPSSGVENVASYRAAASASGATDQSNSDIRPSSASVTSPWQELNSSLKQCERVPDLRLNPFLMHAFWVCIEDGVCFVRSCHN